MTQVFETIPSHLQSHVDAALGRFHAQNDGDYEVTGIVDPPSVETGEGFQLRLVLCGEGMCRQENFQFSAEVPLENVIWLGAEASDTAQGVAELDPPPGALRRWIDTVTQRHDFVLLLFYRGYW